VHRVIKSILTKTRYTLPTLPTPGEAHAKLSKRLAGRVPAPLAKPEKARKASGEELAWQAAGLHCSANERRADEASRDVEAWLKCKYMREHLGEEFGGVVTAATGFGIFVTLDAMYVEGLVHITELGGEYFRFDEARQELRGERTGIRYAIGARVRVQVSRVDPSARSTKDKGADDESDGRKSGRKRSRSRDEAAAPASRQADGPAPRSHRAALLSPVLSPIQSLKAAVKKAAAQVGRKAGKKPRR
jgi:ribonuclease R